MKLHMAFGEPSPAYAETKRQAVQITNLHEHQSIHEGAADDLPEQAHAPVHTVWRDPPAGGSSRYTSASFGASRIADVPEGGGRTC